MARIFVGLAGVVFLSAAPTLSAQYPQSNSGLSSVGTSGLNELGSQYSVNSYGPSPTMGGGGIVGGNRGSLAGWQSFHNYLTSGTDGETTTQSSRDVARFGPVHLSMSAALGFLINSNVNSSPTNPQTDEIVQAAYNIEFSWQATRRNLLQLDLGLNYQEYLKYSQYNNNGLLINPNTRLDYRVYVSDFVFTIYDYPSITNNGGGNNNGVTNSVNFNQLNNSVGLSITWNPNKLIVMAGFQRQDTLSLSNSNDFSSQNSVGYSAFGTISCLLTPTTSSGIRLQSSTITYAEQVLNNSINSMAGLFVQTRPSLYTNIYLEGGMQSGIYTNTGRQTNSIVYKQSNGVNTDVVGTLGGGNYVQPYVSLMVSNRLNRYINQSLQFSRFANGSSVSNYQETYAISYLLQYRLNRVTTLGMNANYQLGQISSGTSSNTGTPPVASAPSTSSLTGNLSTDTAISAAASSNSTQTSLRDLPISTTVPTTTTQSNVPFHNWTAGVSLSFQVMKNTTIGISYSYTSYSIPTLYGSYNQQIVGLNLTHSF